MAINWKKARKTAYVLASCFLFGLVSWSLFFINASVTGRSMEPCLCEGDLCVGTKGNAFLSYGRIVLVNDRDHGRILVKRVIGLPGDQVQTYPDGSASRDGVLLYEPYMQGQSGGREAACTVPEGHVFVLGDNRGESSDSRSEAIGCVPMDRVIGVLWFRAWPINRFGFLY